MRTILAYILVVPLVQFLLTIGVTAVGIPTALLLSWLPWSFRKMASSIAGAAGVVLAVAYGYAIFRFLVGPGSFTWLPFLASSVPLLLPIRNDFLHARRIAASRGHLLDSFAKYGEQAVSKMSESTETAHGNIAVGEVLGLLLSLGWFLSR